MTGPRSLVVAATILSILLAGACGQDYYDTVVAKRVEQLSAQDEADRAHAAWSLGQIGPRASAAVPALAKALSDPSAEVRSAVAEALAQVGDASAAAVPALVTALRDEDAAVRAHSATALGVVGAPAASVAVSDLIGTLRDGDSTVRLYSAWALGEIGSEAKAADEALASAMEDDNADVRRWSAEALLKVRGIEIDKPR